MSVIELISKAGGGGGGGKVSTGGGVGLSVLLQEPTISMKKKAKLMLVTMRQIFFMAATYLSVKTTTDAGGSVTESKFLANAAPLNA